MHVTRLVAYCRVVLLCHNMSASRTELLTWLNELLALNYTKVEQCGSGAAYAQIIDSIYGNVPMSRINFAAKHEYEFLSNFKILQTVFTKNRIEKPIPIERLVRCKMQDNLEFLQWIKKYWDTNYAGDGSYDAEARRNRAPRAAGTAVRRVGASPTRPRPSTVRPRPSAAPAPAAAARATPRVSTAPAPSPAARRASVAPRVARAAPPPPPPIPNETINQLTAEIDEMKLSVDSLERERDFYFGKLRDVEVLVQERLADLVRSDDGAETVDDKDMAEVDTLKQVQTVLYTTEEGFELPDVEDEEPLDQTEMF